MVGDCEHHFELRIGLGNAAFDGAHERRHAVAAILNDLANRVANGESEGLVHDVNGNRVGDWQLDPHPSETGEDDSDG